MIIDFSNRLDVQKVREMINEALDFTTGVVNLSTATAQQVKDAFTDPDRWLCSVDYSGITYLEQFRNTSSGGDIYVYFYVQGAEAASFRQIIYDLVLWAKIIPSTGEVIFSTMQTHYFAPNIIYDLDQMTAAQLVLLADRIRYVSGNRNYARFGAVWTYNGKQYVYSARIPQNDINSHGMVGTAAVIENSEMKIYYDLVKVDINLGSVRHTEYSSNITLTPVQ